MSLRNWHLAAPILVATLGTGAMVMAAAQVPVQPQGAAGGYVVGADVSTYEGRYGTPEFRDIDDIETWPRLRSIRTRGTLLAIPGRTAGGTGTGALGRVISYSNDLATHAVCGQLNCVAIYSVEAMGRSFGTVATSWLHQPVEIIGAIDNVGRPTPQRNETVWAFLTWSIQLATDPSRPRRGGSESVLESLVTDPGAADGRAVTVRGVFRGANLFGDLPAESRLHSSDWVLNDGPYFVWVTGRDPKGSGFALDPQARSDCRWRLEVVGIVETQDDLVYIKAEQVRLLGLARPEASAREGP